MPSPTYCHKFGNTQLYTCLCFLWQIKCSVRFSKHTILFVHPASAVARTFEKQILGNCLDYVLVVAILQVDHCCMWHLLPSCCDTPLKLLVIAVCVCVFSSAQRCCVNGESHPSFHSNGRSSTTIWQIPQSCTAHRPSHWNQHPLCARCLWGEHGHAYVSAGEYCRQHVWYIWFPTIKFFWLLKITHTVHFIKEICTFMHLSNSHSCSSSTVQVMQIQVRRFR